MKVVLPVPEFMLDQWNSVDKIVPIFLEDHMVVG